MKRRGRPRKHNPSIPPHIDQTRLPVGVYWDGTGSGRWYVFETRGSNPRAGTRVIAQGSATLAELFALMEDRTGSVRTGTVRHVVGRYLASPDFNRLAFRSRKSYAYFLEQAMAFKTSAGPLGDLVVDKLSPPIFARIRDKLAVETPAKANTWLRRIKGAFAWGVQDGCCKTNPVLGVKLAAEVAKDGMPSIGTMRAVQAFARERAALKRSDRGHLPPYLAPFIEIAYQCRLRCIEVLTLTDGNLDEIGIISNRRKGSLDNITRWTPGLRDAVATLKAHRRAVLAGKPSPLAKPLLVSESGDFFTYSGFSVAWKRMMLAAIEAGVIAPEDRFTAHGLKHRGITDSLDKGAGGHKSERMRQRYDHEIPVVDAPRGTSGDVSNCRENIREMPRRKRQVTDSIGGR